MSSQETQSIQNLLQVEGVNARGFGTLPKLVMRDRRLSALSKAIYAYFCSYAGAGTTAFPSVSLILEDLGLAKDTYYKHLALLKQYGYLTVHQKKCGGVNRFARNIYTLITHPAPLEGASSSSSTPKKQPKQIASTKNKASQVAQPAAKEPCPKIWDTEICAARHAPCPNSQDTEKQDTKRNTLKINKISLSEGKQSQTEMIEVLQALTQEVLACDAPTMKISISNVMKTDTVKQRFAQLTLRHFQYVADCVSRVQMKIFNLRSYLLAALYNAPTTLEAYARRGEDGYTAQEAQREEASSHRLGMRRAPVYQRTGVGVPCPC